MQVPELSALYERCSAAGRITAEDALAARRAIYGEFTVTEAEIEALVALDEACADRAVEWRQLFVEALTDFSVRQQPPAGYLDQAGADQLMRLLARDGRLRTETELEAMVYILEIAEAAPAGFTAFALAQVKEMVIHDETSPGRVSAEDAALVRRILYAAAGEGNLAISLAEAEALFDINDACRGADNDPAWTDLFAKAIAAAVMMVSGYRALDRDQALRRDAWLAQPEGGARGIGDFLARAFSPRDVLAEILHPSDGLDEWRARAAEAERMNQEAAVVTADEAQWLADRIGRDGELDPAERAVIDFLRREGPQLHPRLQALVDAHPEPAPFGRQAQG